VIKVAPGYQKRLEEAKARAVVHIRDARAKFAAAMDAKAKGGEASANPTTRELLAEAEDEFSSSLAEHDDVEALMGRATVRLELGRVQEAVLDAVKAAQNHRVKNSGEAAPTPVLVFLARCYKTQQRYAMAKKMWKKILAKEADPKTKEPLEKEWKLCCADEKSYQKNNRGFKYDLECGEDVSKAYTRIRKFQPKTVIPRPKHSELKDWDRERFIRFVCISDTHGKHRKIPPDFIPNGDVLIHAGDMTLRGGPKSIKDFAEWLKGLPHKHKVLIAGNHDVTLDTDFFKAYYRRFHFKKAIDTKPCLDAVSKKPLTYLNNESVTIEGVKIYGSPISTMFFNWAFMRYRGPECRIEWEKIPTDTDILITHGPPLGHGDECKSGLRAGCMDLLHTVQQRVRPLYHIFGHIHEDAGITSDGYTTYINASTCDFSYRPTYPAVVFDVPRK